MTDERPSDRCINCGGYRDPVTVFGADHPMLSGLWCTCQDDYAQRNEQD